MANIDLTTYRKDELAERDWMDPCAEFYLASEVDNLIADKDDEIARLKERKSPDIAVVPKGVVCICGRKQNFCR